MEFETYVRQHAQALVRFATVLADDPATAEDVVQEVLLRAHARWPTTERRCARGGLTPD